MKILTMFAIAMLLCVVAFAGALPPTERKDSDLFITSTVHAPPVAADVVVLSEQAAPDTNYSDFGQRDDACANTYTSHMSTEADAVARNGSNDAPTGLSLYKSNDIGAVGVDTKRQI